MSIEQIVALLPGAIGVAMLAGSIGAVSGFAMGCRVTDAKWESWFRERAMRVSRGAARPAQAGCHPGDDLVDDFDDWPEPAASPQFPHADKVERLVPRVHPNPKADLQ